MSVPGPKDVPRMSGPALLAALNDCQNAWENPDGKGPDDIVRIVAVHGMIYKELRSRGMTELAIESFVRTLPNWNGP